MDLARPGITKAAYAVQGDSNTRSLEIELRCNGMTWTVPDGTDLLIRYWKPDGTAGIYDTMPDGKKPGPQTGIC